jgi:predicted nucleotidyltransferase
LFSRVQQRVLGVLFGQPSRSFYAKEIIGLARSGSGAVQRELARLESSGIVKARRVGQQKHYQANTDSPLYDELRSIALKTFGLTDVVRRALEPIAHDVRAAFIFGSVAKQKDTASSDIDALIISDRLAYAEVFAVLEPASAQLGRPISPKLYSLVEFRDRLKTHRSFLTRVMNQPKLWLIGGEQDIAGA